MWNRQSTMRLLTLLFICFYALLSPLQCGTSSSADDRRWLVSLVDLVELDYVDHCEQRANAAWNELTGNSKGLASKLERDKTYGMFVVQQTTDIKSALTAHALSADDNVLRRKVKLLLQPGDTLLDTEQWIRLVTFGDNAQNRIRFATNYDCGAATNCSLKEFHYNFARQQDEETLLRMKKSWEHNLPDLNDYLEHILPLLRNASKQNNYNSVEEYWDALGEYEGAILKARELWENVKPLYSKLHKYIALRLKGTDAVGKPLPVHLLRSLTGDDWSNLIESLLPKHAGIYQKVHANLQLKNLGGVEAFKQAAKLIKALNLGDANPDIWTESVFNSTCPPTLVNWCKPNKVRAITCKDVSIANFIEAHEAVMKIVYKQTINLHSNNTYILREASRYSAVYEAIPGFVSLLSVNPHALSKAGLFPLETFNYNPNYHRLVLQLIMALRDLPKLNFYLAADEWRIKVLTGAIPYSKIPSSWSDFRKNFSNIETGDSDFLGDPYMMFNKPYIGKFMGLVLKYQIYQSFAEELVSDDSDLVNHIAENNDRLIDAMIQGYGTVWPEMVSDLLAKREYGLEYTGLTDYYKFLDEYLDNQLEPSTDSGSVISSDDYVDAVEPVPEENEIPSSAENQETPKEVDTAIETHEDIINNIINTGEESNSKFSVETSTVGVLEIKNPVAAGDQKEVTTKEASYNTYWWIGIAVALAVVVILIAIIARKRHNHRKQLERQRRDNSHA
nr:angiotensin-converting enzyme-like protein Ace3 isoform X3 [Helicoverpa armigera]